MQTIDYAAELPLDMIRFANTIGFPGTDMFNHYHQKGLVVSYDWDDYSFYSANSLFAHEYLTEDIIDKYMNLAYKKSIWFNPRFLLRRIWRGFKTGDFFWDVYYGIQFAILPAVSSNNFSGYYARDRWPEYNFRENNLSRTTYQIVRKSKKAKVETIKDNGLKSTNLIARV